MAKRKEITMQLWQDVLNDWRIGGVKKFNNNQWATLIPKWRDGCAYVLLQDGEQRWFEKWRKTADAEKYFLSLGQLPEPLKLTLL